MGGWQVGLAHERVGDVGLDERVEAAQFVPRQAREVFVDLLRLTGRRCVGAGRLH
jgi:hypothetical protein